MDNHPAAGIARRHVVAESGTTWIMGRLRSASCSNDQQDGKSLTRIAAKGASTTVGM
jgi:hypothetical protein